jgi:DNA-binding CsgD family transcriptional regulator/PAS domain-containing protein
LASDDAIEAAFDLSGLIYDAALDPELWQEVLERISSYTGGSAAALTSHDVVRREGRFHFIWGDNPEYSRSYAETYVRLNPILPHLLMLKPGDTMIATRWVPPQELHRTRFYLEWQKPQDYADNVGAMVERSGSILTMLNTAFVTRAAHAVFEAERRMALIVPHVRRAVAIGQAIEMSRIEAETLGDAVDAIGAAVYLVRGGGEVVRANPAGRELIADGSLFRPIKDKLVPEERGRDHSLSKAIETAAAGAHLPGGAIPLTDRNGTRYVAHVLPLTSGSRQRAGLITGAAVAVFVHRAVMDCVFPIEAVSRIFDLSQAELRVLATMLEVGPPSEIAPVLGVSEATVRTHLRRLFEKTGTSRQADLVKLVAGYASPIVSPT